MAALAEASGLQSRLVTGLPILAAVAFTALVAWSLANLTWQLFAPAPEILAEISTPVTIQTSTPNQTPNYAARIANLHVFGHATREQPVRLLNAPETHLNLTLHGVYATGDERALAIIASGGSNEKLYRVGDVIAGGPTLKAVYRDRVILESNLRMETLRMPKGESRGMNISVNYGLAPGAANDFGDLAARYAYNQNTYGVANDAASDVDLGRLRQEILQNPGRLGDMLAATPVSDNGRFMGYRLSSRGDTQLFSKLGLQDGDIVTSVNGIAIDRPDKGLLVLQDLVKADQVSVTLLRNGTEMTLEHSLR